jgi:DNA-binding CsgD family transcriptional regulator
MLWVGTFNGLNRLNRDTGTFSRYIFDPADPNSLSHNDVYAIYEDRSGVLWIGTNGGGLNRFNRESGAFTRYRADANRNNSLSNNGIWCIYETQPGVLWIGTNGGGLNRLDRETETFTYYTDKDGLPNNVIYGILEDNHSNLWLSTNKGLSRFNPQTRTFKNFDVSDGIQLNEFNAGAYFKSQSGEMFFGGLNGFNAFHPDSIKDNPYQPKMAITGFQVFNQPIGIGEIKNDRVILEKSITETREIELSHKESVFSFKFAALHYAAPGKNTYAYMMEGIHNQYIHIGSQRNVTFTNLEPGEYVFRIKGANNDGIWNEEGISLKITITASPRKRIITYVFYSFIFLVIGGAVAFVVMRRLKKYPGIQLNVDMDIEHIFEKYNISNREREVIELICQGKSNKEIADILYISFHTAKNHIRNIYKKLNVKNRVSLIKFFQNHR